MIETPAAFGPQYPALTAKVQKYRRMARDGIQSMPREMIVAYARSIEEAILTLQRSELQRVLPGRTPHCASGTAHTDGRAISAAIRQQHKSSLESYPSKVRKARTPEQWQRMYAQAMREKQARMAVTTESLAA